MTQIIQVKISEKKSTLYIRIDPSNSLNDYVTTTSLTITPVIQMIPNTKLKTIRFLALFDIVIADIKSPFANNLFA